MGRSPIPFSSPVNDPCSQSSRVPPRIHLTHPPGDCQDRSFAQGRTRCPDEHGFRQGYVTYLLERTLPLAIEDIPRLRRLRDREPIAESLLDTILEVVGTPRTPGMNPYVG
jgi:hypothetical protein